MLVPGVLLLLLAAYVYSESGSAIDKSTQLVTLLYGSEALAFGAAASFASFVSLADEQNEVLRRATRSVFWILTLIAAFGLWGGNLTLYQGLYRTDHRFDELHAQLALFIGALVVAWVFSRIELGGVTFSRAIRFLSAVTLFVAVGGLVVPYLLESRFAFENVRTARDLESWVGWSRAALWAGAVIALGVSLPPKRRVVRSDAPQAN